MDNNVSFLNADAAMFNAGNLAMRSGGHQIFRGSAMDAAIASGMAYLVGELEKQDPKIREPLTSVTWARDIVAKTGGGWVEHTSTMDMDFGTTGANEHGIVSGSANAIPVMQVNTNKNMFQVFTWMNVMKVPFVDQAKLKQIGRSLEDLLNQGIKLNYNKTLDQNVYKGFPAFGTTGLVNNAKVIATDVEAGVTSGKVSWKEKTPDEILDDVNAALTACWEASEYDLKGMPNHILIPPAAYTYIVNRKVSTAGNQSIMKYLMENNIAKDQGVSISIEPCRWCKGAGVGGTDRMVVYVNDEDMVYFDITVPNTRAMTQPSVEQAAYLTLYAAQIGQVKLTYEQPFRYFDGI